MSHAGQVIMKPSGGSSFAFMATDGLFASP